MKMKKNAIVKSEKEMIPTRFLIKFQKKNVKPRRKCLRNISPKFVDLSLLSPLRCVSLKTPSIVLDVVVIAICQLILATLVSIAKTQKMFQKPTTLMSDKTKNRKNSKNACCTKD